MVVFGPEILYAFIVPTYTVAALFWLVAGALLRRTVGAGRLRPLVVGTAGALLAFVPANLLAWWAGSALCGYPQLANGTPGRVMAWAMSVANLVLLVAALWLPFRRRRVQLDPILEATATAGAAGSPTDTPTPR